MFRFVLNVFLKTKKVACNSKNKIQVIELNFKIVLGGVVASCEYEVPENYKGTYEALNSWCQ